MEKSLMFVILLFVCMSFGYSVEVEDVGGDTREISEGLTRYVYGSGLVASVKDSEINYYHSDRIGSNRVVSGGVIDSPLVKEEYLSLPFGQKIKNTGIKYSFATGKELDSSGLYYFGARYLDSDLGKFNSVDSTAGEPAYNYVKNNPLNLVDPDGNKATAYYGVGLSPNQIYGSRQYTPAWGFRGERKLFGADVGIGLDFLVSGNKYATSWVHPTYASYNLDVSIPLPFGFSFDVEHSSEHGQSDLLGESSITLIHPDFKIGKMGSSTDLFSLEKGSWNLGVASAGAHGNTNTLLDMNGPITLVDPINEYGVKKHDGAFARYKKEGKYGKFNVMGIFDFKDRGYNTGPLHHTEDNGFYYLASEYTYNKRHFGAAGYTSPKFSLNRFEEGLSMSASAICNTEGNWQVGAQLNFEF